MTFAPGQLVRILHTAPDIGKDQGIAIVRTVNPVTVTVRRLQDDRICLVDPRHLMDDEVRQGHPVGWFARQTGAPEADLVDTAAPAPVEPVAETVAQPALFEVPAQAAQRVVIVPCGARKLDRPAPAAQLYTGPLFRSAYAAAARTGDRILILSALHGLVDPLEVLTPYNVRLGDPESITPGELAAQAARMGVTRADVTVLGGRDYVELARTVWPSADAPLAGSRGIGDMRGRLARMAA